MMEWLTGTTAVKFIWAFLISMVPVVELRGGLPIAISSGLPWPLAYLATVLGNMLPVPFIIIFIKKIFAWLRKHWPGMDRVVTKLEKRAESKSDTVERYGPWVNIDNPEENIDVPWFVAGSQADPSQALGSGLTYGKRQFLTNYFHIALVDEDVEQYRKKQKEAAIAEEKEIAEEIIKNFDKLLKDYLSEHKDNGAEVKKFIGGYVKGSNYFSIKEPTLAAKLLQDFTNTYLKNENGGK